VYPPSCRVGTGESNIFVIKPEGRRPVGRSKHRWEDNIKIDLEKVGCEDAIQDRVQLRALMNMVMSL
jgi:hypothetical protein